MRPMDIWNIDSRFHDPRSINTLSINVQNIFTHALDKRQKHIYANVESAFDEFRAVCSLKKFINMLRDIYNIIYVCKSVIKQIKLLVNYA